LTAVCWVELQDTKLALFLNFDLSLSSLDLRLFLDPSFWSKRKLSNAPSIRRVLSTSAKGIAITSSSVSSGVRYKKLRCVNEMVYMPGPETVKLYTPARSVWEIR
jgi:hypothetical protein